MRQTNKLFLYKTWIFFLCLFICGILGAVAGTVLLWEMLLFRISFMVIAIILLAYFTFCICVGYFTPVHITEQGIKYRGMQLTWDEIKITAYPQLNKSFQYGYYLIFDNHYIRDLKEIRKKLFLTGCRVYMYEKALSMILLHCKYNVLILNPSASEETLPKSNRKCNKMLVEFNKSIESEK